MFGTVRAFAATRPRLILCLVVGLAVLVIVVLIYNAGRDRERDRQDAASGRSIARDADVKEALAEQRQADRAKAADTEKGLTDATADLPDAPPDPRRLRFNCERLRRQGTDLAGVPACSGLAGGAQAPAYD